MATGERQDPYRGFNFLVEIDGITRAGFQECSGLDVSQEAVDYREGADKGLHVRKLPGMVTYTNITLKRGVTDDTELREWLKNGVNGEAERKNGSVILLNHKGEEKVRWNFTEAWPAKWTGPSFNASDNSVAVETLELSHEGVSLA